MEMHQWNKNKYLISDFPRTKTDMKVWNEQMAPITSTMGVMYLNHSYLSMKKEYAKKHANESDTQFNNLFSTWKSETVPVIEKFRPKNMLYEINCMPHEQEREEEEAVKIIEKLLGMILDHIARSHISMNQSQQQPSQVQSEILDGQDVDIGDVMETMPYPIKIHSDVGEDVWWKLDDKYFVPKISAFFRFYL